MRLRLFPILSLMIALGGVVPVAMASARPDYPRGHAVVRKANGEDVAFNVEIARTPFEHAYGLMFVRSLPPHEGMLFLNDKPEMASFWMRNTLIPLDIIYVNPDGHIQKIFEKLRPLDETPRRSDAPVAAILEINGGLSEQLHIAPGDVVSYSAVP